MNIGMSTGRAGFQPANNNNISNNMNEEDFEDLGRLEACPPSAHPNIHSACLLAVSRINRISAASKGKGTFS